MPSAFCLKAAHFFHESDRIAIFPIPDSRFPIPDSRFPIPDSRFPIPYSPHPLRRIMLLVTPSAKVLFPPSAIA
ncbi:MAG: hypothetical protein F6K26_32815 [Moorea sp. SIO2I5]|nr:hypothetical protein [Moorena sp. SIO2I5]